MKDCESTLKSIVSKIYGAMPGADSMPGAGADAMPSADAMPTSPENVEELD
jgi:hypothetical protein